MNIELYNVDEINLIEDLNNHENGKEIVERLKAQWEYYNSGLREVDPKIRDSYFIDKCCLESYEFISQILKMSEEMEKILFND